MTHWIVNSALSREGVRDALIDQLGRQGVPHTLVRKPPFVPYLVAMHDDPDEGGHDRPIVLDGIDGPVFVTGTTSMAEVSAAHGWAPGYIDAPTLSECTEAWGDRMLNAGAAYGALRDVVAPDAEEFFVRPDGGDKAFAGRTMRADGFEAWRRDVMTPGTHLHVPGGTRIAVAPLRRIWAEYRCIVAEGRFVTGSRYRTGRTIAYSPDVGRRIVDFVDSCVADWNPRIALCVDVADTPEGLRIIETNAVSSCGFYCIDMEILVREITAACDRAS